MIEQQTMKMSSSINKTFINNANRLKAFPQGLINDTVHLSKGGIRGMWDDFYKIFRSRLNSGRMTNDEFIKALIMYSKYTDDFIEHVLKNVDGNSTKEGIQSVMSNWRKSNPTLVAMTKISKELKKNRS